MADPDREYLVRLAAQSARAALFARVQASEPLAGAAALWSQSAESLLLSVWAKGLLLPEQVRVSVSASEQAGFAARERVPGSELEKAGPAE
jgi:hypothetical protein